jgi:formyltetrahydrofolate deformylase
VSGIVAAVTTYLAGQRLLHRGDGAVRRRVQRRFFMRAVFRFNDGHAGDIQQIKAGFSDVAKRST